MPKFADDASCLAQLQDYYARWRVLPAYEALRMVLGLASGSAVAKVLRRLQAAGFLDRTLFLAGQRRCAAPSRHPRRRFVDGGSGRATDRRQSGGW